MTLFTFGVYNEETVRAIEAGELDSDDADYDEIDVQAHDRHEAQRLARIEADEDYGAGSTLFPVPPGGSGGFVRAWTL